MAAATEADRPSVKGPAASPSDLAPRAQRAGQLNEGDSPCPACGEREAKTLFHAGDRLYRSTTKSFLIVECAACRLIRLFPSPSPAELATYYPPTYWYVPGDNLASGLEETYRRFVLRDHLGFIERALRAVPPGSVVADIGCGGGLLLRMLRDRGHRGIGLDFSLDAASAAWRIHGVPVVCGSLASSPLPPKSCGLVTMFHILEHLFRPGDYLEAAYDALLPEGRLVVQVPNADCWQFLLLGENWSGLDVPRHLVTFRAQDLEILLDQCGFEVVRVKHFSLRDNPAGLATSLAPGLDPMARRIRGVSESPSIRIAKNLLYFALVASSLPLAMLEAACRAGSTIMVEARKKSRP